MKKIEEIKGKITANEEKIVNLNASVKSLVGDFVTVFLGEEFKALHVSSSGFRVSLVRDGKEVFGCGFDAYVNELHYNKEEKRFEPKFEMNIGTCGSFEVGANDDQEKKYTAFACFMTSFVRNGVKDRFMRYHNECNKLSKEIYKLQCELDEIKKEENN